ncbi:hypothetical protein ABLG96_12275 [Nakamurella sp. A5-74]|uniref:ATP synthase subunit I n=1 Tax=Nakamurella sp. A5-74 TaxID=3158264 RepID=A0AAU8DJB1_9ACTN
MTDRRPFDPPTSRPKGTDIPAAALPPLPPLNLAAVEKAARRSASGGVWSLGHLRICWAVLAGFAVLEGIVAGLVSGGRGILGVAIGSAIVGGFFTVSTVIIARVGAKNPKNVMKAALVSYLGKVIALGVVLVMIPRDGGVDTKWMAGSVAIGVFAWLGAHMRYVWTTKIFYVDPS